MKNLIPSNEIASHFEIPVSAGLLAKWRNDEKKGTFRKGGHPLWVKIGGRFFYPAFQFSNWLEKQNGFNFAKIQRENTAPLFGSTPNLHNSTPENGSLQTAGTLRQ